MAKFYLSSTLKDLKDFRKEVCRTLELMHHEVISMENYPADSRPPLERCLADVAKCDAYIGIFAWRYGYIPEKKNPQKKAITELEYREAVRRQKMTLIFLLSDEAPWPGIYYDKPIDRINALREELKTDRTAKLFQDCRDLEDKVSLSVNEHFPPPEVAPPVNDDPVETPDTPDSNPPPTPKPFWKRYAKHALIFLAALAVCALIAREIKVRYWPDEYPTERIYDFYLTEKNRLNERWDFPPGQWSLEKGEGENENDAALLVKGNQIGIPNDLGEKVFYDYRAEFKVRFKEGDKVAWVLRAQRDRRSGYLFELKKEGGTPFIRGLVFKNNRIVGDLPGDKALEYSRCCNPTDGLHVVVNVVKNRFTYKFTFESDDGHDTPDTARPAEAEFVDGSAAFKWGSFGLLVTDGITSPETGLTSVMKVEYVILTPLPRGHNAADSSPDRSTP